MNDKECMRLALEEARRAYREDEIPIGAVLVSEDGTLISAAHNKIEQLTDATAHAEILALRKGSEKLKRRRLSDCTLYSTVEPCAMCAGALMLCRVKRIVYGIPDSKFGAAESLFNVVNNPALNHQAEVTAGVLEDECRALMKKFFNKRRSQSKIGDGGIDGFD
ncbi:MAG: tRNA adenosine(34) deaminase TadA [Selenomonadaceae bacterium]|nr:tRNA adenosine(34) deaminase TadA [Selenomonadaceae bacterium]